MTWSGPPSQDLQWLLQIPSLARMRWTPQETIRQLLSSPRVSLWGRLILSFPRRSQPPLPPIPLSRMLWLPWNMETLLFLELLSKTGNLLMDLSISRVTSTFPLPLVCSVHESPARGHGGNFHILHLLWKDYWWPVLSLLSKDLLLAVPPANLPRLTPIPLFLASFPCLLNPSSSSSPSQWTSSLVFPSLRALTLFW